MKVVKERVESEMMKAQKSEEQLDLRLGKGSMFNVLSGHSVSVDWVRKLVKELNSSVEYLSGEDLQEGSDANLDDRMEISGEALRSRRESMGWSQVALSEMCGFRQQSALSMIETGKTFTVSRDTMMALAYLLKCSLWYLGGRSEFVCGNDAPKDLPEGYSKKQIVSKVQGARIALLMKGCNLRLGKVAESIGIPRPMLARLKAGATVAIPEISAVKLARVLAVDPSDIIITTKNSKRMVGEDDGWNAPETPASAPAVAEPSTPVKVEVVEAPAVEDTKVSLNRLAQITAFAEKHPEVLHLLDQMMNLKDDQIAMITGSLDLMIKGAIVS